MGGGSEGVSSHSSTVVIDFCLGSIVFPVRWGLLDVSSHSSWYIMVVPGFELFGRSAYAYCMSMCCEVGSTNATF